MSVLEEICDTKRKHIEKQKSKISLENLKDKITNSPPTRGFLTALKSAPFPAIIAEIKKASPSKGVIRQSFDPLAIAETYENNGAACLSILTDEPYFQGHDTYLHHIKAQVNLPLLRKDFMVDPYQIYESRALGADCILLIMAALEDSLAKELFDLARTLEMDILVEIHDEKELERALVLNPTMIGVNNRNLKTMDVSVETSKNLAAQIPNSIIKIAESGLSNHGVLVELSQYGYKGFLIGESLMREDDIGQALKKIRGHA